MSSRGNPFMSEIIQSMLGTIALFSGIITLIYQTR